MLAWPASSWAESVLNDIRTEWDEVQQGRSEWYLPLHTWHNRANYTKQQIAKFNEDPWGIGFGKGLQNERQDWRGLYVLGFLDSHKDIEVVAGYAHTWKLAAGADWNVGGGYTAMLSFRRDINNYRIPALGLLPVLSVGSGQYSVYLIYLPRIVKGHADVAFFIGKVAL